MTKQKILAFAMGPIASALISLISLPIMAWVFNPEDLGRLNILQVALSFSLLLAVLGLDQAYGREYHSNKDHPALLKACFEPGFVVLSGCTLLTLMYSGYFAKLLFGLYNPWLYVLLVICVFANYTSRFLTIILRMQERGIAFSISQVIPKAMQLMLFAFVLILSIERTFLTLLCITVVSMLTAFLIYTFFTREQWLPALKARPSPGLRRSLLKFGVPLVISGIAYWGLTATSTFMLRSQSTLSELGLYSVTNSFAGLAVIIQSIFSVVWAPTVYKWLSEGVDMANVDNVLNWLLALVSGVFAIIGCFSFLTDYILPEHYINVKYLLICAVVPPLLYTLSEVTCVGIAITRRTSLTVWITLAALVTNLIFGLWLVPANGASGAVIANALAYFVFFMGRTEVSARIWRYSARMRLYIHVVGILGMAIATVRMGSILPFHYSIIWVIYSLMVLLVFNTEFRKVWVYFKGARLGG